MKLILYNNNAEKNRLNKSAFLKHIITMSGDLRMQCDLVNPAIVIQLDPKDLQQKIINKIFVVDDLQRFVTTDRSIKVFYDLINQIISANYCYIPDFNRYYFITGITSVNKDLWQLSMRVDVLMSYYGNIKDLNGLISRNQYEFNPMLSDNNIFLQYNKSIEEYKPDLIYDIVESLSATNQKIDTTTHLIVDDTSGDYKLKKISLNINSVLNRIYQIILTSTTPSGTISYAFYTDNFTKYVSGGTYSVNDQRFIHVPTKATGFAYCYNPNYPDEIKTGSYTFVDGSDLINQTLPNNVVMTTLEYGPDALWYYSPTASIPDNNVMSSVYQNETENIGYGQPWVMPWQVSQFISSEVLKNDVLGSFIVSTVVYPFVIRAYQDPTNAEYKSHDIILGDNKLSSGYYQPSSKQSQILKNAEFTINGDYGNYLDYDPYTRYELYIPYCQWITLSPDQILNKRLQLNYVVSYTDGSAFAYLIDVTDNKMIWGGSCQLGILVPTNTSNALEISRSKDANTLNMVMGLIASTGTIIGGVATSNPVAVVGGIMGGVGSVTSYISKDSQMFEKGSCTISSGNFGLYAPTSIRVRKTKTIPIFNDEEYASLYGKPLNEYRKIGNMSGFTQIGEIHIENIGSATDGEITEIDQLLKSGIII